MFIGSFQHNIDSKGRVSIPVRFREVLQGRFEECLIITADFDGCLAGYPKEEWQTIAEKAKSLPMMQKEVKEFMRFFYSRAVECPLDKQGRILITPELREYAGVNKEVILVGMYSKIEIWNIDKWREMEQAASRNSARISESMASLGL
ncbi:MAG: division/cell wall cluster transcriptional repressor MraZ [Nitrospirae bacterium]|nr:division/cell wall cluster transcriptional repressor MraZ [Nitrospirota bacterium]